MLYINNPYTDAWFNLAAEEYLLKNFSDDIFMLWQNEPSVIIGKHQNVWNEINRNYIQEKHIKVVRRYSGGGAVYHDLGNVNFTFLVQKENYNVGRQLDVIIGAMRILGIQAERSGRNDILADGKKFSGNAFYRTGDGCYHHGTILIRADKENMSRYLNVSEPQCIGGQTEVKRRFFREKPCH